MFVALGLYGLAPVLHQVSNTLWCGCRARICSMKVELMRPPYLTPQLGFDHQLRGPSGAEGHGLGPGHGAHLYRESFVMYGYTRHLCRRRHKLTLCFVEDLINLPLNFSWVHPSARWSHIVHLTQNPVTILVTSPAVHQLARRSPVLRYMPRESRSVGSRECLTSFSTATRYSM